MSIDRQPLSSAALESALAAAPGAGNAYTLTLEPFLIEHPLLDASMRGTLTLDFEAPAEALRASVVPSMGTPITLTF